MDIFLSPRLACCAGFVRRGDTAADIGTDHGYIPIWLIKNGVCPRAYASDVRPGPLENARSSAAKYGVEDKISFLLCDGLSLYREDDADTVIIAGMGGEMIAGILAAAPWTRRKRLILQPQTKRRELWAFLSENGYAVTAAKLAKDAGKIYEVWLASGEAGIAEKTGKEVKMPAAAEELLCEARDPLLAEHCEACIGKLAKALEGLMAAERPDGDRVESLKREIEYLESMRQEALSWQE